MMSHESKSGCPRARVTDLELVCSWGLMGYMRGVVGAHSLAVTPPASTCTMPAWTLLGASAETLAYKYAC